jgi:hypothetical protein
LDRFSRFDLRFRQTGFRLSGVAPGDTIRCRGWQGGSKGDAVTRKSSYRISKSPVSAFLIAALLLGLPGAANAHEIPSDVTVQVFVKPEARQLQLLVRVPLSAMRDVDFPRRGPGYLDLARVHASLRDAATLWISNNIALYEDDVRLQGGRIVDVLVSLPSDRSFTSYEDALAHVTGKALPNETELYWNQAMLDVLFEYPIRSDQSRFSIHPGLDRLGLRVVTVIRFLPTAGVVRAFEFSGDPGLVRLDPRWDQAAQRFVELGFLHILGGIDHLLFLLCLVIPLRRIRPMIAVVTAFTVAHSITLLASAFDLAPNALWFPPLIETLIAMSIFYMALENIVAGSQDSVVRRRWTITFAFGLVHGFGFSFALRQTLQLAGSHLLTSLLCFNLGIELGQLLVLLLTIPVLHVLFRFVVAERMGVIILSAVIAHTAWHWMIDRGSRLSQFPRPAIDVDLLVRGMRWLMLCLVSAGITWLVAKMLQRRKERLSPSKDSDRLAWETASDRGPTLQDADDKGARGSLG